MTVWNKGLTKETSEIVRKLSIKSGNSRRGRKLSEEHKKKIKMALPHGAHYKGGRSVRQDGYVTILMPTHPRANKNGRVREHIVIAEKKIGRSLTKNERIHHINGIRSDNRPENLVVLQTQSDHIRLHNKNRQRDKYGKYI